MSRVVMTMADYRARCVVLDGARLRLSPLETEMLSVLLCRRGMGTLKSFLIEEIYGTRDDGGPLTCDKIIEVTIHRLRRRGIPIESTRREGYMIAQPVQERLAA